MNHIQVQSSGVQIPKSELVLLGPWHRASVKRKTQSQSMSYLTCFGYIFRMKWVTSRRGRFLSHTGNQNLVPAQVQTAVVMPEDPDPWGIHHNKNKREADMALSWI